MAGFFQRILKLGSAEANSIVDMLEDPVKMTEQGIRDLKKDLDIAMKNFAEVKATAIRAQREMEKNRSSSVDWERKAMALLQQGQSGALEIANAERLAGEALTRKEESSKHYLTAQKNYETQNKAVTSMQGNIERLKSQVQQYENELVTLKARARTAEATKKINKQLSSMDSSGTLNLLERMKDKVEEEETLALAYGDMASEDPSVEDEIDKALLTDGSGQEKETEQAESLAALKAKMGIN
ncbi:MAG: PspA/IM30 family protein [Proteobacteria bacterium]|nr:PspA/IM30 family protein [Pseudomonadota bacterium]